MSKKRKSFFEKEEKEKSLVKDSNILNVESKIYKNCGKCEKEEDIELTIPIEIWAQWLFINGKFPNKEWLGVFWVVDNRIVKFYIPKQEVSYGECEMLEDVGGNGIVHWHHTMGAFHSGQDDKHCRNLYDWSIVLSTEGRVVNKRVQIPCGGFVYMKGELEIEGIECDISNISEKTYAKTESYGVDYGGLRYVPGWGWMDDWEAKEIKGFKSAKEVLENEYVEDDMFVENGLSEQEENDLLAWCDSCLEISGDACKTCDVASRLYGVQVSSVMEDALEESEVKLD